MLWRSWGTWPDPIIDFGRELYLAWRLSAGDVLYRDLAHLNGPLSPYLNALWFTLFGANLRTLVIANLIIWALLLYLMYRIVSRIADRFSATIACLGAIGIFSFARFAPGDGSYNFICPYSHGLTHGLVLSVLAIWLLHCFSRNRRPAFSFGAGLAFGLVALTKAEVFLACSLALLPGLVFSVWHCRDRNHSRLLLGTFLIGSLLPPVAACALLSLAMPVHQALWNVLGSWRYAFNPEVAELPLYRVGSGLDDVPVSLIFILGATGFYAVLLIPAALAAIRLKRFPAIAARPWSAGISILVACSLYLLLLRTPWQHAALPWPLFLLVMATMSLLHLVRCRRGSDKSALLTLRTMMFVFALGLLLKMILNTHVYHYGFALALPAMMLLVAALLCWIPNWLTRAGGCGALFRAVALGMVVAIGIVHLRYIDRRWAEVTDPVASGANQFLAARHAQEVNWAVAETSKRLGPEDTLVVVPEGAMINFLSARRNPTPYVNFMPPEVILFGEQNMLESLQADPPDFAMVVHKDTSVSYGVRFFGWDYGQRIFAWIESEYCPVSSIGAPPLQDERFGIVLLERCGDE
ncbi:MAG: hypothetical protein IID41_01385 [Planctomycetes bacterium]|nr:hypothetical protein [Planctomycetota bacterium]